MSHIWDVVQCKIVVAQLAGRLAAPNVHPLVEEEAWLQETLLVKMVEKQHLGVYNGPEIGVLPNPHNEVVQFKLLKLAGKLPESLDHLGLPSHPSDDAVGSLALVSEGSLHSLARLDERHLKFVKQLRPPDLCSQDEPHRFRVRSRAVDHVLQVRPTFLAWDSKLAAFSGSLCHDLAFR